MEYDSLVTSMNMLWIPSFNEIYYLLLQEEHMIKERHDDFALTTNSGSAFPTQALRGKFFYKNRGRK